MALALNNRLVRFFFFGNYFYGICAVALSTEATLQQRLPLNEFPFFLIIFCSTVLFYTKAYLITEKKADQENPRTNWYFINNRLMIFSQAILLTTLILTAIWFAQSNLEHVLAMGWHEWVLILLFPIAGSLYYGIDFKGKVNFNLRTIGWLKPFIIGFTWAGMVTVYPVIYYGIDHGVPFKPDFVLFFLFIKNLMFVAVLSIMFDIKDYEMDYNQRVKTFVVEMGLKKTIYFIIIPLLLAGLTSFLVYAILKNFTIFKMMLNTIPFLITIAVAYNLRKNRSIFYYLVVIDGLMLVKAICGSVAMRFF